MITATTGNGGIVPPWLREDFRILPVPPFNDVPTLPVEPDAYIPEPDYPPRGEE